MNGNEYRKQLRRLAHRYGYNLEQTRRGGHYRLVKPGFPFIVAACSSSDPRALRNTEALIRRHHRKDSP